MPCNYTFTNQQVFIIAAYYQAKDKDITTLKFRHNWVFEEETLCDTLIRNEPEDGRYIYVTETDNFIKLSSMSRGEIEEEQLFEYREFLRWEPNVGPDGNVFYKHSCMVCGEGLHREKAECMACGFCKEMLDNADIVLSILDDHNKLMITNCLEEHTWTM